MMAVPISVLVSQYLTHGGDDRICLNKQGVNKYYVAPEVEATSTIQRAFCTCSPPSPEGFKACCQLIQTMQMAPPGFAEAAMEGIRTRLKANLGIQNPDVQVVLHPSGTDAEYLPLLYALQRSQALGCPRVVNIVAAGGEVGSHTATAASGLHVSNIGWSGKSCAFGKRLEGWEQSPIKMAEVLPRCRMGRLRKDYDAAFEDVIADAEAEVPGAFYIVHTALTKTGLFMPSHPTIDRIIESLQGRMVLVFDACQLRASEEELQWYLERQAFVLVTGSKFLGGPGFSGAVVCPRDVAHEFATNTMIPSGLSSYLTKADVPASLAALRNSLSDNGPNIGLMLRWLCALTEMEAFNTHREYFTSQIPVWVAGVREAVMHCTPYLELSTDEGQCAGGHLGGWNTTICIRMHVPGSGEPTLKDLKHVQLLLLKNLRDQLPASSSPEEREAVSRRCVIGQPVWLGNYGVLRISLGAPITRQWKQEDGVLQSLFDDRYLLRKWVLIIKYFKELSKGSCHVDQPKFSDCSPVAVKCAGIC